MTGSVMTGQGMNGFSVRAFNKVGKEAGRLPHPEPGPLELPLSVLTLEPTVFQIRGFDGNGADSTAHVKNLAEAISDGMSLEPLKVWWSGLRWLVIDGHHRLSAYYDAYPHKTQHKEVMVPVSVFRGSLLAAYGQGGAENTKDKLPAQKDDKANLAWRLTCLDEGNEAYSIPEVCRLSGAKARTISNMRRVKGEMLVTGNADGDLLGGNRKPADLTWKEAIRWSKGKAADAPKGTEWVEAQATAWAVRLGKEFSKELAKNPEVALRALQKYSTNMVERMFELWKEEQMSEEEMEDEETELRVKTRF